MLSKGKRIARARRRHKRCPKHGVSLLGIWHRRGMCPVCWAAEHPLQGYCMLCGDATRVTWQEKILCDDCEYEFRQLFGQGRLRVPLATVSQVRELVAFVARRIFSNLDALEGLAKGRGGNNMLDVDWL